MPLNGNCWPSLRRGCCEAASRFDVSRVRLAYGRSRGCGSCGVAQGRVFMMVTEAQNMARTDATRASAAHQAGAGFGGLVTSKTSLQDGFINLSKPECALRRIARLKKAVWASGHLHGIVDHGARPPVCWFVTLTYKPGVEWQADHISKAVQAYRDWCRSVGVACRYTWVAELQKRGAVHYHLLAWLPKDLNMPHWDRSARGRRVFWPHGMSNTEPARSGVGYLMKYLSKLGEFHRFPKGLRLYGIGGLNQVGRSVRSWFNLPEWAKRSYGVGELCRRAGRLVVQGTGEILAPAFRVSLVPGGLVVRQLRELPERFHTGAYSSVTF